MPDICIASSHPAPCGLAHEALFYRGSEEALARIGAFIEDGVAAGEPTVALLPEFTLEPLRGRLGALVEQAQLQDVAAVGRNPARILPLLSELLDGHSAPARVVCELLWPGRSEAEVTEVGRHEALINLAFKDAEARILCAYDADAVGPEVLACAEITHARVSSGGRVRASSRFRQPSADPPAGEEPLALPTAVVDEIPVGPDLRRVRREVASSAAMAELSSSRREDFVLALDEAASNALQFGEAPRTVRLWRSDAHVVGEVAAQGRIEDPLAGRRRPEPSAVRGRGLWIINQLCDLVQLRNTGGLTLLRLHMRCE